MQSRNRGRLRTRVSISGLLLNMANALPHDINMDSISSSVAELISSEAEIARLVAIHCADPTGKADPILDGLIDPVLYVQAPVKILWILKEPWDGDDHSGGGWDLCKNLLKTRSRDMMKRATFRNIYYITHGMFNGTQDWDSIPYPKNDPNAAATLQSIAFINAKKLPGPRRGSKATVVLS